MLDARAGVLEREFGFGVVRQLFEAVAATEPPPAGARSVFGEGAPDGLFAVLSALFSYTATLASRRPLVLCIDDLQWSDTASLRFVAYLTRRIATLPVLVATTIRTGEPDSDELLLGEVGQDPATVTVQPRPLTEDGTAGMVSTLLGEADDAFAAACQEVTAGNPLLLRQLLTALAAEKVVPDAAHAASVRAIGPRAVSRTVLLRLARLPAPAAVVARAIAVLGEQPGLRAIAALAGGEGEAAEAIDALVRAEILRPDEAFVHPLVRDAVYGELPAARRGLEHARAARLLFDLGAWPERIAAQLMPAPPRADAWVVERLREAAAIAVERGAPEAALSHLQRAQAEPPAPELRSALTLELGAAAEFVRGQGRRRGAGAGPCRAHRSGRARARGGDARPHAAVHGEPGRGDGRRRRRRGPSCRPSTRTSTWRCGRSGSSASSSASPTPRWPRSRRGAPDRERRGRGPRR